MCKVGVHKNTLYKELQPLDIKKTLGKQDSLHLKERKKERNLKIWVNLESVVFVGTLLNYLWKWLIVALTFSLAYEVSCIEKISR